MNRWLLAALAPSLVIGKVKIEALVCKSLPNIICRERLCWRPWSMTLCRSRLFNIIGSFSSFVLKCVVLRLPRSMASSRSSGTALLAARSSRTRQEMLTQRACGVTVTGLWFFKDDNAEDKKFLDEYNKVGRSAMPPSLKRCNFALAGSWRHEGYG